jgi:hypothetical protein
MEAFELLYRRHKNHIFGFLMSKLKDQTEDEEVFQAMNNHERPTDYC